MEHFCTLFDSKYLAQGLAMFESLHANMRESRLWVLAMDHSVVAYFRSTAHQNVYVISLSDIETDVLRKVKEERNVREYCWTITPFLVKYILTNHADVSRVTYVDADVFFFRSPAPIFQELGAVGKDVLITEHGYDPAYDFSKTSGRFCVQFMPFNNTSGGHRVLDWWSERCIEWCHDYFEDGKFGDQLYLDAWPTLFSSEVHIFSKHHLTLAPWNLRHCANQSHDVAHLIFFHFHLFKIFKEYVKISELYDLGPGFNAIYPTYIEAVRRWRTEVDKHIAVSYPRRYDFAQGLVRVIKVFASDVLNYMKGVLRLSFEA